MHLIKAARLAVHAAPRRRQAPGRGAVASSTIATLGNDRFGRRGRERIWALIGQLKGRTTDQRINQLESKLAEYGEDDITDFADQLAQRLYDLDTPVYARAAGAGGDAFLYIRCAVVLRGRATFTEIVAKPLLLKKLRNADAEPLLYVAQAAFERSTGRAWEHETPVSVESGTNAIWTVGRQPDSTSQEDEWPPPAHWLVYYVGDALLGGLSPEYELTTVIVPNQLNDDPAWRDWWRRSTKTERLEAQLVIDPNQAESTEIKKGSRLTRAEVVRARCGFQISANATDIQKAHDDIKVVITAVYDSLDLPMPPQFPVAPTLPVEQLISQRDSQRNRGSR